MKARVFMNLFFCSVLSSHVIQASDEKKIFPTDLRSTYQSLVESEGQTQGEFYNSVRLAEEASIPFLTEKLPTAPAVIKSTLLTAFQMAKVPCQSGSQLAEAVLSNSFWLTRYNAAAYLAMQGCIESSRLIVQKVQTESDPRVKTVFIDAIGMIGNSSDESLLKEFQNNQTNDQKTRLAAATALARLKLPFDETYCQTFLSTENDELTPRAIEALSHSRNTQALTVFNALTTKDEPIGSSARIGKERLTMNMQNLTAVQRKNKLWEIINTSEDIYLMTWAIRELIAASSKDDNISNLRKIALSANEPHQPVANDMEEMQKMIRKNIVRSILLKEGMVKINEIANQMTSDGGTPHAH